jgi:hypothetical protein
VTAGVDQVSDLIERLRYWRHATIRRDGSTLATMSEAADEIERLRAENFALAAGQCNSIIGDEGGSPVCKELERLRADAERYRWLRNDTSPFGWLAVNGTTPEKIDAAIDAAMKEAK